MSSKLSDTFRQRKGSSQPIDSKAKKTNKVEAQPRSRAANDSPQEDDETERALVTFDLTNKFGPCKGVTRLERWQRAQDLGLSPPQSIRDIILEADPESRESLNQSIWENRQI